MPTGHLREPISNINRTDIVVVTKCDEDMKPIDFRVIEENMKLRAHQLLFFTSIVYGEVKPVFPSEARFLNHKNIGKEDDILLISGIAVPTDHHTFSKSDFKKLDVIFEKMTSPGKLILVTEKDAARLKNSPLVPESWKKYLYYLPIVIRFYNEQGFNETIKKHIITFPKNNILQNKYE